MKSSENLSTKLVSQSDLSDKLTSKVFKNCISLEMNEKVKEDSGCALIIDNCSLIIEFGKYLYNCINDTLIKTSQYFDKFRLLNVETNNSRGIPFVFKKSVQNSNWLSVGIFSRN